MKHTNDHEINMKLHWQLCNLKSWQEILYSFSENCQFLSILFHLFFSERTNRPINSTANLKMRIQSHQLM